MMLLRGVISRGVRGRILHDMSTIRARARRAGLLYQLMGIPGAVGLLYIPTFIVVPGDAAATARNILASDVTYRLVVLCGLISCIGFSLLAISLYNLFI